MSDYLQKLPNLPTAAGSVASTTSRASASLFAYSYPDSAEMREELNANITPTSIYDHNWTAVGKADKSPVDRRRRQTPR